MRIGVDFPPDERTGTGRVTRHVMAGLHERSRAGGLSVLTFVTGRRDQRPSWLPESLPYLRHWLPGRVQAVLNRLLRVPVEALFHAGLDVLHTLRARWVYTRLPVVATILDVSWRHFPGRYDEVVDAAWVRSAERLIRSANHIHAISSVTADDLIAGGVPPGRVTVAHLGVDGRFRDVPEAEARRVRNVYALPDRFVLYVGAVNVRKNFPLVPRALGLLASAIPVVAAGPPPPGGLPRWGFRAGLDRHLGFVPDDDLPGLYASATALVLPSLLEGFGLPLLEAMTVGTPVLASDIPIFREIGHEAPWYFPPDEPGPLARAIDELFRDDGLRRQLSAEGRRRASAFRWEHCIDGILDCCRMATRGRAG